MASTAAFVQGVLSSVCLDVMRPTVPPLLPTLTQQQKQAAYVQACDATNEYLRLSDGQLVQWMKQSVTSDLANRTIRLGVKKLPTKQFLSSEYEPDRWSFRVIDILSSVFNFTPEYVPASTPTGGVRLPDNSWSGLTEQLLKNEVEMTGSFLVSFSERLNLVSFGETIGHSQIGLLIEKPKAETRDDSLLAPFTNKVWRLILVSMIMMGPLIWALIRFRVWLATTDENLNRIIPLTSCVWFVYGALMKQGSVLSPVTDSSRMLFATWWIFITVVTAFYTANLTAYMTFSALKISVGSIEDISRNQRSWLAPPGDGVQMFVERSEALMHMKRAGKGSFINLDDSVSKIINQVRKSGYVYIDEVSRLKAMMMADYYSNNRTCHVYVVPLKEEYIKYSLATNMESSLNSVFDPFVHWLVMSGISSKWKRDAEVDAAPCATPKGIQGTQLMNEELRMIYFTLLISYGCSVALLLLEIGWGRLAHGCRGAPPPRAGSLSVLQRVLRLHAAGGKTAWPSADQPAPPTTTYTYGMSVNPASVSTWSRVTTALKPGARRDGGGSDAGAGAGRRAPGDAGRPDSEVLREMRDSIKYINNRPYMFVKAAGSVRPVPVTEDKNDVFERIFNDLKQRQGGSRLDEQFGELYSPEGLMKK